jgi:hypothetical protein
VSGTAGSSPLTSNQSDWFETHVGQRYLHVQTDADTPSRKQRRALKRAQRRRPDGRPYGG